MSLVEENQLLTIYIPASNRALVFRVKSTINKQASEINYGPLPIKEGDILPTYEGASITVPADGVLPAKSFTYGITFPMTGTYDETDMWYIPDDYRDRVFHVIQKVTPSWLRVDVQIPIGVTQNRFQRDKVVGGVDRDLGFNRGELEVVHLPRIRYGYRYGNDTNIPVRTFVKFIYAEYVVEIPRNPDLIFDVLTKRIQSHWVTLPVNVQDPSITQALELTYGMTGFTVPRADMRETIREFIDILRVMRA